MRCNRDDIARWCKALGHPSRVHIVEFLAKRSTCMCGDIAAEVGGAQSTVSQHLKVLKEAGLIQGQIDGPRVCYCLQRKEVSRAAEQLGELLCLSDLTTCDP